MSLVDSEKRQSVEREVGRRVARASFVDEVTEDQRFRIYELAPCESCRTADELRSVKPSVRCGVCKGSGTELRLLVTTPTREGIGVAIATLADDALAVIPYVAPGPLGVLDGIERRWLAIPWGRRS